MKEALFDDDEDVRNPAANKPRRAPSVGVNEFDATIDQMIGESGWGDDRSPRRSNGFLEERVCEPPDELPDELLPPEVLFPDAAGPASDDDS
jgi:hypothetical protein